MISLLAAAAALSPKLVFLHGFALVCRSPKLVFLHGFAFDYHCRLVCEAWLPS